MSASIVRASSRRLVSRIKRARLVVARSSHDLASCLLATLIASRKQPSAAARASLPRQEQFSALTIQFGFVVRLLSLSERKRFIQRAQGFVDLPDGCACFCEHRGEHRPG
jgi:hypothetical protein